jgi:hypothetical protein
MAAAVKKTGVRKDMLLPNLGIRARAVQKAPPVPGGESFDSWEERAYRRLHRRCVLARRVDGAFGHRFLRCPGV